MRDLRLAHLVPSHRRDERGLQPARVALGEGAVVVLRVRVEAARARVDEPRERGRRLGDTPARLGRGGQWCGRDFGYHVAFGWVWVGAGVAVRVVAGVFAVVVNLRWEVLKTGTIILDIRAEGIDAWVTIESTYRCRGGCAVSMWKDDAALDNGNLHIFYHLIPHDLQTHTNSRGLRFLGDDTVITFRFFATLQNSAALWRRLLVPAFPAVCGAMNCWPPLYERIPCLPLALLPNVVFH